MKRLTTLLAAVALVVGSTGFAAAQTPPAATKPSAEKKMPVRTANGTVKSATADSLVVAGKDKGEDLEWTFSVNDQTKIKKAGKDVTAKDLTVGDVVNVRYMDHDGKSIASAINVRSKPPVAKDTTTKGPEAKPVDKK